jgi:hypothetical protein
MTHSTFKDALRSVFRPVWRPLPAPGPEGFLARLAFAAMALTMMWGLRFQFDSQDVPTGLAHFVDLTFLSKPGVMAWVTGVFAVLCVPYVFAQGLAVVLPLLTLIHCSVFAFFNSQGYKSHGNQIISLILLAQAAVVVFFAAHRWIKGRPFPLRAGRTRDSYLIYYSQVVIAGVYMTSVVSKLDVSNFRWVQNLPNMSVQLVKTHRQEFYSKPETSTVRRDAEVPAARWMIDHPHQTRLLLGSGLLLEALCFLVLANRGWALVLGVSITVMHIAIASLMRLYFDFNVYASLIFLVNAPFWIAWIIRRFADHQEAAAHSSKAPPAGR